MKDTKPGKHREILKGLVSEVLSHFYISIICFQLCKLHRKEAYSHVDSCNFIWYMLVEFSGSQRETEQTQLTRLAKIVAGGRQEGSDYHYLQNV
jgi:hypothetical protein